MSEPADERPSDVDSASPPSWWARLPLVRAWVTGARSLRALLVVIGLYGALHVGVAAIPPVQRASMAHMHLAPGSYALWSLQHARPAMYNFGNEYFLSPLMLSAENVDDESAPARQKAHHLWLNHYPFQVPLWWYRQEVGKPGRRFYMLLRSRFRGEAVVTRWVLQSASGTERGLRFVEVDW